MYILPTPRMHGGQLKCARTRRLKTTKAFRLQRSSQTRRAMLMCLATSCAACAISVCYSVCFSENCALEGQPKQLVANHHVCVPRSMSKRTLILMFFGKSVSFIIMSMPMNSHGLQTTAGWSLICRLSSQTWWLPPQSCPSPSGSAPCRCSSSCARVSSPRI